MKVGSFTPTSIQSTVKRNENQQNQTAVKLNPAKADSVSFTSRTLVKEVFKFAQECRAAYGAFNAVDSNTAIGIIRGLNRAQAPGFIQASKGAIEHQGGMDMVSGIMMEACKMAKVPVIRHLDHGDFDACIQAIESVVPGQKIRKFHSVMIDASHHNFDENVRIVKAVADYNEKFAKKRGLEPLAIEAELGKVAGKEDNIVCKEALYTDPKEAAEFVKLTGCDSLAVSIGTKHGPVKAAPGQILTLDFDRLRNIKTVVKTETGIDIPVVLHGASSSPQELYMEMNSNKVVQTKVLENFIEAAKNGKLTEELINSLNPFMKPAIGNGVPELTFTESALHGINKINIANDIVGEAMAARKKALAMSPTENDIRKSDKASMEAIAEAVARKATMARSNGLAPVLIERLNSKGFKYQ